jgi:hypothetical protein
MSEEPEKPCRKCEGSGKDLSKLAVPAKVPGEMRVKLVSPLCDRCGGKGTC